jgi:hypothetical protein
MGRIELQTDRLPDMGNDSASAPASTHLKRELERLTTKGCPTVTFCVSLQMYKVLRPEFDSC